MGTPEQAIELDYLSTDDLAGTTRNDGTSGSGGYCISIFTSAIVAQEDPGKEMWTKYMNVFGEYDKRISDAWKQDADGLLVFVSRNPHIPLFIAVTNQKTGLFSATVGAFIIESYKSLSPDPTVVLLRQISQQLAGFNGTFPNLPTPQPSSPNTSAILVNAMWLMSLVLSITSALLATLLQQWARRYTQMPQIPSLASHRARVRSYLFLGTLKYGMNFAVETVPTLLHISVFLFFIGLVIFFFPINKAVAIAVSVSVGVFAGIYFTLTILPFFGHKCPYRTPMSRLWWYPWHASLSFGALCLREVVKLLHKRLVPLNSGQDVREDSLQGRLNTWLRICEVIFKKHQERFKNGFGKSIIQGALDAPVDVDREAVSRLFSQLMLADKNELPNFVASIPKGQIVQLTTPPIESGTIVFRESLILIRNCAVDANAAGLDVEVRKRCTMVSLEAVNHIAKAITVFDGDLLRDLRTNFADIGHMRRMWGDDDAAIRANSRSICALLARCLLRIQPLEEADLRWLGEVIGKSSNEIYNRRSRGSFASLDYDNLKSFVHGVLLHREGVEDFPAVHTTSFMETLAILVGARTQAVPFNRAIFSQGIQGFITSVVEEDGPHSALATKLRMFLDYLRPPAVLPIPSLQPEPEPEPTPAPAPAPAPAHVPAHVPAPVPAPVPMTNGIGRVSQETFYTPGSIRDLTLPPSMSEV